MNDMSGKYTGNATPITTNQNKDSLSLSALWLAQILELQEATQKQGLTLTFSGPKNSMQIRRISANGLVNKVVAGSVSVETVAMQYD